MPSRSPHRDRLNFRLATVGCHHLFWRSRRFWYLRPDLPKWLEVGTTCRSLHRDRLRTKLAITGRHLHQRNRRSQYLPWGSSKYKSMWRKSSTTPLARKSGQRCDQYKGLHTPRKWTWSAPRGRSRCRNPSPPRRKNRLEVCNSTDFLVFDF